MVVVDFVVRLVRDNLSIGVWYHKLGLLRIGHLLGGELIVAVLLSSQAMMTTSSEGLTPLPLSGLVVLHQFLAAVHVDGTGRAGQEAMHSTTGAVRQCAIVLTRSTNQSGLLLLQAVLLLLDQPTVWSIVKGKLELVNYVGRFLRR